MKIKEGFIIRTVGGEHVVVPVGANSKIFKGMITLNETGAFLWKFFACERSVNEAVQALMREYAVEETVAKTDVQNFVDGLKENGFIEA